MKHIQLIQTILYVSDQQASTAFYQKLFRQAPEWGHSTSVFNSPCSIFIW
ncbi:hypothetical protein [Foetidibacter luteolus]|nr:hypothetical protein [Foetidibacter luteolus]